MRKFSLVLNENDPDNLSVECHFDPPLTDDEKEGNVELPFIYATGISLVMALMRSQDDENVT